MPELSAAAVLQIALLLSAVPAQYFLTQWSGSSAAQRDHATARLLRMWEKWSSSYLNRTAWSEWTNTQMSNLKGLMGMKQQDPGTPDSPSIESMLLDNDLGFFGASKDIRSPRPPFVFLRVGEVVMERNRHMVGVVVSWDPELRAPAQWTERMYSIDEGGVAEKTPHYKVLFNGPAPSSLMIAYLPQTQLERVTGTKPNIPTLERYFTHYDGTRFVMQPWLRELFPDDQNEDNEDVAV